MAPNKHSRRTPNTKQPVLPGPQIKNLAVSLNGWAMTDGMNGRETNQIITARSTFLTLYSTIITNNNGKDTIFRSSLDFSESELANPINGNRRYLIVGYAPRAITQGEYLKKNKAYGKPKTKSIGNAKPTNVIPWDSTAPPILVVTEIPAREDGAVSFWALLWPKNGLCTPFAIKIENIIFRWEFRTFTNTKARKAAWTKSITEAVKIISCGGFSTSNDMISSRNMATNPKLPDGGIPRPTSAVSQHSVKTDPDGGNAPEVSYDIEVTFPNSRPGAGAVPPTAPSAPRAMINNFAVRPGSLAAVPPYQRPNSFQTPTKVNSMDDEPLAPETLQTARELHRIAQESLKAERDKLIAQSQNTTAKEVILNKLQAALSQEKEVFQKGVSFQAKKLTEREKLIQIWEQRVYEREQSVQARENALRENEQRTEKTEQKLRGWEQVLTERGQVFVEQERRYREEQARLKADEKQLQDREAAVDEDQKALYSGIAAIRSLSSVQQNRKRKAEFDHGGRRLKKQRDGTGF
ncbi:hypothetical protein BKA65DRAFT_586666 [Rhexocercosporidium sp. MPI-PUGE-AT-0058]|nr:hypothetical protein BKA65DRAFT_586666 [Rhexocercosporidium sp. MPI-PUGE-AT-0058]